MNNLQTDEPLAQLNIGNSEVTLLGTAHVSKVSAEKVSEMIAEGSYDAVAIELCPSRHNSIVNPDSLAKMDLFEVFRRGKAMMVAASLALGAYQQRLADEFGIKPGAEMRAAIDSAAERHIPVLLVDREIGITMKRVYQNVSWFRRLHLMAGLVASLITREKVTEAEIEKLKEGDILETAFAQFAEEAGDLFEPLIKERDQYMSARILQEIAGAGYKNILVVIGAGHLKGMKSCLEGEHVDPVDMITALEKIPQSAKWPKLIPWLIVVLIVGGFITGFLRSPDLGWQLVADWVFINGGLAAFGALLAWAHPLTIVTAFFAAPVTSLNPMIGAGMVTAAAEVMLRRPSVGNFSALRADTRTLSGWWHNRVTRTLLIFIFSTLGSVAGTYIAGIRILERLI